MQKIHRIGLLQLSPFSLLLPLRLLFSGLRLVIFPLSPLCLRLCVRPGLQFILFFLLCFPFVLCFDFGLL
jgi:hypothetical protein